MGQLDALTLRRFLSLGKYLSNMVYPMKVPYMRWDQTVTLSMVDATLK